MPTEISIKHSRSKPLETIGSLVYDLGNGQWVMPELRILLENIFPQKTVLMNINQ